MNCSSAPRAQRSPATKNSIDAAVAPTSAYTSRWVRLLPERSANVPTIGSSTADSSVDAVTT